MQDREIVTRRAVLSLPLAMSAYGYAASGTIRVGVIGCGGRGEAAAMNAMNAGKDVRIVAMGDLMRGRVLEKRTSIKLKYPDQVEVTDER